ncbi:hypothetical protein DL93DRAFT_2100728 [Clavulina sp. PMI_390]|nr:hypothetical protein DL93DRAFT_2100728 [Clavulina sp. PMI_390]
MQQLALFSQPSLPQLLHANSIFRGGIEGEIFYENPKRERGYLLFLSILSFWLPPTRSIQHFVAANLNFLSLTTFVIYSYRDIWPLATYYLVPADEELGLFTWVRIGLLGWTALIVPGFLPRYHIPVDPKNPLPATPEQTASIISSLLYSYMDPVIVKASKHSHLPFDQLPPLADVDHVKYLREQTFPYLDPAVRKNQRHIFFAFLKIFAKSWLTLTTTVVLDCVNGFLGPIATYQLLHYVETGGKRALWKPCIAVHWYQYEITAIGVRTEGIITQLLFEHALRIRVVDGTSNDSTAEVATPSIASHIQTNNDSAVNSTYSSDTLREGEAPELIPSDLPAAPADSHATASNFVGRINNLISSDLDSIVQARELPYILIYVPLKIALSTWFLYVILGWSTFVGIALILVGFVAPGKITAMMHNAHAQKMKKTDERVQAVTETIGLIRLVKMFGWEKRMQEKLRDRREVELSWLKTYNYFGVLNAHVTWNLVILSLLGTYTTFTVVMKQPLSESLGLPQIFSSLGVLESLRLAMFDLLHRFPSIIKAKVSIDRVDAFLRNTELLDAAVSPTPVSESSLVNPPTTPQAKKIGFSRAHFTWLESSSSSGGITPSHREFTLRIDDEIVFAPGNLNLVIGPTGSGKSSLLLALLGELHYMPISSDSWMNLPRDGGVSYCAQEPWILNETIKENILFGSAYDEERYKQVLHQCALERDIELFEAGDETEVGERGLTLSRPKSDAYPQARVSLARAVYSMSSIVLLDDILSALDVHTIKWVIDKCLSGNLLHGRTVILVTHTLSKTRRLASKVVTLAPNGTASISDLPPPDSIKDSDFSDIERVSLDQIDEPKFEDGKNMLAHNGKLIATEEVAMGHVSVSAMILYLRKWGGFWVWVTLVTTVGNLGVFELCLTWWLGRWGRAYDVLPPEQVNILFYLGVYVLIVLVGIVNYTISQLILINAIMRTARALHQQLAAAILGTTFRFLDETPVGRILQRFTKDIGSIEDSLPKTLYELLMFTTDIILRFSIVISFAPAFALPSLVLGILGVSLGQYYIHAQLPIKREMSNARAPVFSVFETTISGLTTIRAYGVEERFKNGIVAFLMLVVLYIGDLHFAESMKRIDHYTRTARPFWNLNRSTTNGREGFGISTTLKWKHYLDIEQEQPATISGIPPASWPTSGTLSVAGLCARYSAGGPNVLHGISFNVNSGEKIGVEGEVYLDGLRTSTLNLENLRSAITMIPQQPELMSGTVRDNLDPFGEHDDAVLNDALRASGLFSLQENLRDEERISLDTTVGSSGGNFSVGQRQILALGRALVRRSHHKTDTLIQESLRTQFRDSTVITIAHRLHTIMDADRVLVLNAGRLVEYDSPSVLLSKDSGVFKSMVDGSGDRNALYSLAAILISRIWHCVIWSTKAKRSDHEEVMVHQSEAVYETSALQLAHSPDAPLSHSHGNNESNPNYCGRIVLPMAWVDCRPFLAQLGDRRTCSHAQPNIQPLLPSHFAMNFASSQQSAFQLPRSNSTFHVDTLSVESDGLWKDSRLFSVYLGIISLCVLLLRAFRATLKKRLRLKEPAQGISDEYTLPNAQEHWKRGHGVVFLEGSRVIACLALSVLSIFVLLLVRMDSFNDWRIEMAHALLYVYLMLLSLVTLRSQPGHPVHYFLAATVNLVSLTTLAIYTYRDLWPLATYYLIPADRALGVFTWVRIGLLGWTALVVPGMLPRHHIPVDPKNPLPGTPEQTASIVSSILYSYMDSLIVQASKRPHLSIDELPPLADVDHSRYLRDQTFPDLDPMIRKNQRHIFFAFLKIYGFAQAKSWFTLTTTVVLDCLNGFIAPVATYQLLHYVETGGQGALWKPWFWLALILVRSLLGAIAVHWYQYEIVVAITSNTQAVIGVRTEGIITQLLFEHALRIRVKEDGNSVSGEEASSPSSTNAPASTAKTKTDSATSSLAGRINNLISSDLDNIVEARELPYILIYIPLKIALSTWFLYVVLGWSTFVGMALMLAGFLAPGREDEEGITDERVQAVTETVGLIRLVKMFGWETRMQEKLYEHREEELSWERHVSSFLSLMGRVESSWNLALLSLLGTYATYTMGMKKPLSGSCRTNTEIGWLATIIFSSLGVLESLRLAMFELLRRVPSIVKAKVSIDRVDDFLRNTELLDVYPPPAASNELLSDGILVASQRSEIGISTAHFTWSESTQSGSTTPSRREFTLQVDGEIVFAPGALTLIAGPTGSGKSSLLLALLGELHYVPAGVDSWVNLPRDGGVSYCAQEPWILNETIKARVSLARAVYSESSIVLLDDVLSALDVHTIKWIVDKCLPGDLLHGRTVILVTHNLSMTRRLASKVVTLTQNGSASISVLPASEALENSAFDAIEKDQIDEPKSEEAQNMLAGNGKLIAAEEVAMGRVSLSALLRYLRTWGGFWVWVPMVITAGSVDLFDLFLTWWLGVWGRMYDILPPEQVNVPFYLGIYCLFVVVSIINYSTSQIILIHSIMRSARKIHQQLAAAILGTTFRFLDKTPVGRILQRFTKDIGSIDSNLPRRIYDLLLLTILIVLRFVIVVSFAPAFAFPSLVLAILGVILGQYYIHAQLPVKREMSNARAPVFSVFGVAINGLTTIRAYGVQERFKDESLRRIDNYTRTARPFWNLNRWVGLRGDYLGGIYSAVLAGCLSYLLYVAKADATQIGFLLNVVLFMTELLLYWIRYLNTVEVEGKLVPVQIKVFPSLDGCSPGLPLTLTHHSLERIQHYLDIEQEQAASISGLPPASWPTSGALSIKNLSARYSIDGPSVLHDLNFVVNSGEKIGVDGEVYLDGLPTSTMNLESLRSAITMIPQQPELMSGTVRDNLDPFGEHDDAVLNDALRASGLFSLQENLRDEERISLDTTVSSSGGNFSVGQRQILALGRALVRRSHHKTDALIQESLRTQFHDATVITIAHRLHTIMDADRVLVLDAGCLVEYDSPKVLLSKDSGVFKSMVDGSGDRDALYALVPMVGSGDYEEGGREKLHWDLYGTLAFQYTSSKLATVIMNIESKKLTYGEIRAETTTASGEILRSNLSKALVYRVSSDGVLGISPKALRE